MEEGSGAARQREEEEIESESRWSGRVEEGARLQALLTLFLIGMQI